MVLSALQLLANPIGHLGVAAKFIVGDIEGVPVGFEVLPVTATRQGLRSFAPIDVFRERVVFFLLREVVVPGLGIDDVVEDFARSSGMVAVVGKVTGEQGCVGQDLTHLLPVVVEARLVRGATAHDGRAARVAGGGGAVGVVEEDAAGGQAGQVGCDGLRMPAHGLDPVVEVIERDEEDVGRRQVIRVGTRKREDQKWQQEKFGHLDALPLLE